MRWPLRRQVLLPLIGTLVLTVAVVSALNAWLAARFVQRQWETQLQGITQTLAASNFPLESNVLRQIRGLAGAEFVVVDSAGQTAAASDESLLPAVTGSGQLPAELDLSATITVKGRRFIHAAAPLERRAAGGERMALHVFYPEAAWREARWQAIWPPPVIGAIAIALVTAAAYFVSSRVTRPIEQLQQHVGKIAAGQFAPLPLPARDDELRDLSLAVNCMAETLANYQEQTRHSERLRTLGILGGGIAHQLRNASTGCRIALDLHERDCPLAAANGQRDEPLAVAAQQLAQIETHIQRLLTLGRPPVAERHVTDLDDVVLQAIELARPLAAHVGVEIAYERPPQPLLVRADSAALVQLAVNLLINAVEAAARIRITAGARPLSHQAQVQVQLRLREGERCELAIVDSGSGPPMAIHDRLFEPFASDKPGGTGLGLAVARQIALDHAGTIRWERRDEHTWFLVELPAAAA